MTKKLTKQQIKAMAEKHDIPYACLRAVIEVECKGDGFMPTGEPVILFERHKFWQGLGKIRWFSKRKEFAKAYPSICNRNWGGYNSHKGDQHKRLQTAISLVDSQHLRAVALESCSWGIGQVMGYHWKNLGYASLQAFINDMYQSEAKQLEAMMRYIKIFGLADKLKNKRWKEFARGYNGSGYRKNRYDEKLKEAYKKYAKVD